MDSNTNMFMCGNLVQIKELYYSRRINLGPEALLLACNGNNIPVINWLFSLEEINDPNNKAHHRYFDAFLSSCENGNLEAVIKFHSLGVYITGEYGKRGLEAACTNRHINIIGWYLSQNSIKSSEFKSCCYFDRAFQIVFSFGYVGISQKLYQLGVNVVDCGKSALRDACIRGHDEVINWFLELPEINNPANKSLDYFDEAIRFAELNKLTIVYHKLYHLKHKLRYY